MRKVRFILCILCTFGMFFLFSCSEEQHSLEELERIKMIGDDNPKKALAMLDSLKIGIREESDYVRNKYDLLQIRLNDKADNVPNSDIMIKNLISYFEENGSMLDKQEVYYYAGSVYRDLQDTPRSLEYFLKSIEYAENENNCNSIIMRNAYSNLNDLYYKVQNYNDALKMAQKELYLSLQLEKDAVLPYLHLGTAYRAQSESNRACEAFNAAYEELVKTKDSSQQQYYIVYLMYNYSVLKEVEKAKDCFKLIEQEPTSGFQCMALARYYELIGLNDSAIVYCKRILDEGSDIYNMYDAAKLSFYIYNRAGKIKEANQYAGIYMQLSDSLDFGKRQELAATVNNEFQYHLDQKKEQTLKDEKEKYKNTLTVVVMTTILLASIGYIFYVRRRNKQLQQVVTLSAELKRVSDDEQQLRKDIEQKEKELEMSKKSLDKTSDELSNVKRELQRVNTELSDYDEALKAKEQQLSEKMDQNKTFIKLLHQSELEGKAEDVIYAIRQSTKGMKNMKSSDWKQLYQAVDELYPLFKDRLLKELGNFTEQQMQVCYLMRIGLSKPQIQSMTELSRVTIWRWVKKYDWVLTPDEEAENTGEKK